MDLVYTWQFAQGSFINVVLKNIEENFHQDFEHNYFDNLGKTMNGNGYNNNTQFSSFSEGDLLFGLFDGEEQEGGEVVVIDVW